MTLQADPIISDPVLQDVWDVLADIERLGDGMEVFLDEHLYDGNRLAYDAGCKIITELWEHVERSKQLMRFHNERSN